MQAVPPIQPGAMLHAFTGIPPLPWPVVVLFAAPVAALLLAFFVFKPFKPEWTHLPILASCAAVAAASVTLAAWVYAGWGMDLQVASWMVARDWVVKWGIRVDGLAASMLAMVSVVGGLLHVYAAGYMKDDPAYPRFFLCYHLFFLAMLGLIVSNNYVQLYLFWELVGMASYLLIGFWWQKETARRAALQAFMTNRVGDFGFMLAVLILISMFPHGITDFFIVFRFAPVIGNPGLIALVGLLLVWAACAKSAQFPLYFWLPDAMEGPTPVSALMHAATMVTAGVFLLARSWPLISTIAGLPGLLAAIGAFTTIFAGIIAGTKKDLKRILAYSTVSHLGLMVFGLGLGQVGASVFHLITHGFFKAALFCCAGAIAHGLGKTTASVDEVGGLRRKMPVTFGCFLAAALSLAGVWPFAGFYSKDAILGAALERGPVLAATGMLIGIISAFYIFRMLFLAFYGPRERQMGAPHVHEAPAIMAVPVVFLALGSLCVGWLGKGYSRLIASGWPIQGGIEPLPGFEWKVFLAGTSAALIGAALAYAATMLAPDFDWEWRESSPRLAGAFESDLGWKSVIGLFVYLVRGFAQNLGRRFDKDVWDGVIESTDDAAEALGEAGSAVATGNLNDYLWWMLAGTAALLAAVLR